MTGEWASAPTPVHVTGTGRGVVRGGGVPAAAVSAVRVALGDAGLARTAVTGLLACGLPAVDVADTLGFELNWRAQESDGAATGVALAQAVDAVASGRVRHLVCVDALDAVPGHPVTPVPFGGAPIAGWPGWHAPYGADSALVEAALAARAYTERYGLTRTELAQIALVASTNSGGGLRLRDYLSARMVADPLCGFDRAAPAGGAAAIVLSGEGFAGGQTCLSRPVSVLAVGAAYGISPLAEVELARTVDAIGRAATELWSRVSVGVGVGVGDVGVGVGDVGVAMLGDEFSFRVLAWLEALGFCAAGQGSAFVATGRRIARDGVVPVNPHGGHLGLGRRPDLDLVVAAVTQLRGEAAAAQVAGPPEVAVVGLGGPTSAGCLLLRR